MSRRNPRSPVLPAPRPRPDADPLADEDSDAERAAWLGERLRRVALGSTAALLTARAFWPSEPDFRIDAGSGLVWVFALLIVAGLALASALIGGTLRLRWSWADLALVILVLLVAASSGYAIDRRPAINLAWEWGGFGIAYLLVRNLPRTRAESLALVGAFLATAVAVSVFGLYQVSVELPALQRHFLANRDRGLLEAGVTPGTTAAKLFENRLLGSNEPYSTFALANSLAGFLVGPLVLMLALVWTNLTHREAKGSRVSALALALPPLLAVVVCLTLTKSRSAWIGLAAGLLVLAWRERRRVRPKTLAIAAAVAVAVVAVLVVAGVATRRLDLKVLTEAPKSFRYRQEYWIGAWRAITASPSAFWRGYGPGNFSAPYLLHKLPEASEEIKDPHNLVLEVWSTAGFWAVLASAAAIAFGLWNAFGPSRQKGAIEPDERDLHPTTAKPVARDPSAPPDSASWLVIAAGLGWLVVLVVGNINLIEGGDFERWMILGTSWLLALACGLPLWRRVPLKASTLGAAAVALLVNLTAAGGIGIPTVALAFWTTLALALNLRLDRPCSTSHSWGSRMVAFGLAAVWAAMLGTFVGAITPYWRVESALAEADEAIAAAKSALRTELPTSPKVTAAFERAEAAYERAEDADKLSSRPWLGMAALEYLIWDARGGKTEDLRWRKIPIDMLKAVSAPRAANSWVLHRERAFMTGLLLKRLGNNLKPLEVTKYRANVVEASRAAVRLYPTNASLHARLAEASDQIGMTPDALSEGQEALRLDAITPHEDKKLEPAVRDWLNSKLRGWKKAVLEAEEVKAPKPKSVDSKPGTPTP